MISKNERLLFVYAVTILTVSLYFLGGNLVEAFGIETVEETSVKETVTLEITTEETEEVVVVAKKLEHRVSVTGNFDGDFDHKMINASGKFTISGDVQTFVLVGTFENEGIRYWNPYSGEYETSNPNCQIIIGDLVLQSVETEIDLVFEGQTCTYGLMSYVIGTFETGESTGTYAGVEGEGRITFVADHHDNKIIGGQLKGNFE